MANTINVATPETTKSSRNHMLALFEKYGFEDLEELWEVCRAQEQEKQWPKEIFKRLSFPPSCPSHNVSSTEVDLSTLTTYTKQSLFHKFLRGMAWYPTDPAD